MEAMNSDNDADDAVGTAVEITVGIVVGILENFSDTRIENPCKSVHAL